MLTTIAQRTVTADVVIIGGGVIGSAIAYQLRQRLESARVIVVERDPTYARASSRLATGGVRQQYGSSLNVALAQYSVRFYERFDTLTATTHRPSRIWFRQRGYLFTANQTNAGQLERRYERELASGARVERWTPQRIASDIPGLATDDLALGVFGPDDGYLDPREVLAGMRTLAEHAGAEFVHGEATAMEREGGRVSGVQVATSAGVRRIDAPIVVNAAGAWAAQVGGLAGVKVPVSPVRQHLFRLELDAPLPSRIPMLFDPDGTHWRLDDARSTGEGERLVIGRSQEDEPAGESFALDMARLTDEMLPTLRRRYPVALVGEVAEAWTGLYEMTADHNGIVGEHHALPGFIVAAGFSGHGLMLAPATGLAVVELIADGRCTSFDVSPLCTERFERGALFRDDALI